jgi:hypothetical protein
VQEEMALGSALSPVVSGIIMEQFKELALDAVKYKSVSLMCG